MTRPRGPLARPRLVAPLTAASLVLLLAACDAGGERPDDAVDPATAPVDPDGDVAVRDPAPEIEAAAERASAEASETWLALQENWGASVGDVKARFDELDAMAILGTGGERGALLALIAADYEIEPAEAERRLAEWEATL